MSEILEGSKAPSFALKNTAGESKKLADYAGSYLVIYFYPKDDTPGCTKEACSFRDLSSEFAAVKAQIVGVSPDDAASHNTFIEKYGLNFELLCDPTKTMMSKYGAWGEKNMYGKISQGVIRSTLLIDPQGKVVKHWKRVSKADLHPTKVLEALQKHLQSLK